MLVYIGPNIILEHLLCTPYILPRKFIYPGVSMNIDHYKLTNIYQNQGAATSIKVSKMVSLLISRETKLYSESCVSSYISRRVSLTLTN